MSQPQLQQEPPTEKPLPPLRPNLNIYPSTRTITGAPTWVIFDPVRHRYFNIGRIEFEILRRWNRAGSFEKIIEQINQETSFNITIETIETLIKFFYINQLLRIEGNDGREYLDKLKKQSHQSIIKWLLHHYLFFRIPLVRPDNFLNKTLPFVRFIFTPNFTIILILLAFIGVYMVSRQFSVFINSFPYFFSVAGLLSFGIALIFAKIIHELGHAYTAKIYGLNIPTMGIAFLVMWPVLYTDASDAWKLTSYRQRMWIDSAGVIAELKLTILALFLWNFLPDGPFRSAMFMLAVSTLGITLLINMNIFMRYDGYYLLSDYLGINNLQTRSFALGRWFLREKLFGLGDPLPEHLPRRKHNVMILYAYGTWIYRFFLFLGIALLVYFLFFKLLGIFLMMVEIIWFLIMPIYKEILYWIKRRADMRLNKNTIFSFLLFTLCITLLITPWQTTFDIPAIYRNQLYQKIFSPISAKILDIKVSIGQQIKTGETLFLLEDPEIQYKLEAAQLQEKLLKLQLARQPTDKVYLENTHVLQQQLAETQAEIEGYKEQQAQLQIKAPISGEIVYIADALRKGRWINPNLMLARIIDKQNTHFIAYVDETQVKNITIGGSGRFYPDIPDKLPINAKIIAIDSANITQLQLSDYYVASIYGGEMPVKQVANNHIIPQESAYKVYLLPDNQVQKPEQVYKGTIVLKLKEKQTIIQRSWRFVNTIFIRESGF
jgi:putative peptide zinc metalloprotease protein